MAEIAQTFLSLCVVSVAVLGLGGWFVLIARRALQSGRVSIRGMVSFDKAQNPSAFMLVVLLYVFGGGSFLCFAVLIFGTMGLYVLELVGRYFLKGL